MGMEITGIRELSLDEWDRVGSGAIGAGLPVHDTQLSSAERATTTVGIVPCDFKDIGGNIGFTNLNVCWSLTDNATGEGNILLSTETLNGEFAGGWSPIDPSIFGGGGDGGSPLMDDSVDGGLAPDPFM